jgi:hypothetical protein
VRQPAAAFSQASLLAWSDESTKRMRMFAMLWNKEPQILLIELMLEEIVIALAVLFAGDDGRAPSPSVLRMRCYRRAPLTR